ncbi:MAG: 2-succinyl-5-enolpyruvyl-6-hydroxy-3-cyclohexene-1-carboxylic-acid synthase [Melioribacteraceae bacterium]|nr:2-succinyl-5-enolpyruvyl-6-hydroxy-3-cyclohexene-1-carboxylic-acid synthase [Melioribacteraceae bacterium]
MKKFINRNILWSEFIVDTLLKFGIKNVVICPGSRNTPLIFALAKEKRIKKDTVIDERSAGFFAMGIAKKTKKPTAVATTSGTAVANLYPSVVEAFYSNIPLIVITADRPEILHNCGANQTINQKKIYANNSKDFQNITTESISKESFTRIHKRVSRILIEQKIDPGPVQINIMFDKPFEPESFTDSIEQNSLDYIFKINKNEQIKISTKLDDLVIPFSIIRKINSARSGLIIAGGGVNKQIAALITKLAKKLSFPVFVDASSELFFSSSQDIILKSFNQLAISKEFRNHLHPDVIIQFGKAPTSNSVLQFFESSRAFKIGINEQGNLYDPSRTTNKLLKSNPKVFIETIIPLLQAKKNSGLKRIITLDKNLTENRTKMIEKTNWMFEGKIYQELLKLIPDNSNLFIGNSLPIRDFDSYAIRGKRNINLFTNRGASGIDGIVSTTLGIASKSKTTFLVLGDQSFFHDLNSLLIAGHNKIPLTIILVNNRCGGIFKMLPAAKYKAELRKYLSMNYNLKFENIIKSFNADYFNITSWKEFEKAFKKIDINKLNVLEILTDADQSVKFRKFISAEAKKVVTKYYDS